jgi:nitrite reductase/ring-hydroxylating ferredoxin subunit/uncharacterized membrane protein
MKIDPVGGRMAVQSATQAITRQEWLTPVEKNLQHAIHKASRGGGAPGQRVKNALHGTWLGHPLHAVLTDVPIGSWTAAMVFDVIDAISDRSELGAAADAALMVGIVGALGAAAAGLTDWQDTDPPARRIGLIHGLLNIASVGLFASSLIARKRESRVTGRRLSALGYAISAIAARLGGNLVYGHRVGVDRTSGQRFPDDFVPVLAESELGDGRLRRVQYNGTPILLVRRGDRIFALAESCSHWGGPLSEGKIVDGSVKCPWHGSRFALEDGRVLDGPAVHPQPCLEVRVRNGQIEIGKPGSGSGAVSLSRAEESPEPANWGS